MQRSDQINELASALSKAQGEMKPAIFDSKNPHFGNEFASLTSLHEASHAILSKNGLSVSHLYVTCEGKTALETVLMHSSGQWLSSTAPLITDKQNMQGMGSATTYAKRFSLAAIIALPSESDDDAEGAVDHNKKHPQKTMPKITHNGTPKPTQEQLANLETVCKKNNWTGTQLMEHLKKTCGVTNLKDLSWLQYENVVKVIQAMPKLKEQSADR